jgi:hypothetical protein
MLIKKYILIVSIIISSFCFPQIITAEQTVQAPETIDEAKEIGLEVLDQLPGATKNVWQEEALPFLNSILEWAKGPWENYIKPKLKIVYNALAGIFGQEIEKRAPAVKEEFEKEKEEMIKDVPDFWQRIKVLFN